MIVIRNFSQRILNTNSPGFQRGRKYDMDFDRFGRMDTSHREMSKIGDLRREQREMKLELSRGLRWSDLKDD